MTSEKTFQPILRLTITAAVDLPAYSIVNYSGHICTAGEKCLGVTDYSVLAGELVSVIVEGTAVVQSNGNLAVGNVVSSDATGKAILQTEGAEKIGIVVSATSGFYATILLTH